MILWRISRHRDLSGAGGLRAPGRWHDMGQPVVYLAESAASAFLEVCVHTAANDVPPDFTLLRIEAMGVRTQAIRSGDLPGGWQWQSELTRRLGTDWLRKKATALLRVPSAIVPETSNFLLNPMHADAQKVKIAEAFRYPFDVRLKE